MNCFADCITPEVAGRIQAVQLDSVAQERINELAKKANTGTLTEEERGEYQDFVEAIDRLAIFHAKARLAIAT
ncbi:MAG: DUF896 domain-containing protein [Pirellulaceae bacterium]